MRLWFSVIASQATKGPWPALATVTVIGWALSLVAARGLLPAALCTSSLSHAAVWAITRSLSGDPLNPVPAFLAGWVFMVLAMTPPLLAMPLQRVWRNTLARRRPGAVFIFLFGYGTVWFLSSVPLFVATIILQSLPVAVSATVGSGLMLTWQLSWPKRRFLTLCHRAPSLRLFGSGAWLDVMAYGVQSGAWCVGTCGLLMIVPMLLPRFHLLAMLAVAVMVAIERYRPPREPEWRQSSRLKFTKFCGSLVGRPTWSIQSPYRAQ